MDASKLGVNLQDYQNPGLTDQVLFGTGQTTQENLNELTKALEAQQITGGAALNLTTAGGAPLKVESLDKTLKLITFKENEIVLWKKIPKLPAYNTVEEFNQLTSYGADRGGFLTEGELPKEEDSTYVRRSQLVKYLGVTKAVTHPMMLVNQMVGDIIEREVKNGSLWILRKLDRGLTKADSSLIPQEFNGLFAQHYSDDYADLNTYMNSDNVVDLRGEILKEADIETASEVIIENHGYGTDLYGPPKVLSGFVQNFYGSKLISPNSDQVANGIMGQRVRAFDSQYGRIELGYDIFLNKESTKLYNSGASTVDYAPVPTGLSYSPVAATVANSKWTSTDAGDYFYGVVAVNRFGESAMTVVSQTAATIVANGAIDITFTHTTGVNAATAYVIYRSNKNATAYNTATYYPLFTVTAASVSAGYDGGTACVRDNNRILPNTNQCFIVQNDDECLAFRQLAPLMKMDLAVISPAFRFMILLYGTPLLFAPKKMVRIINIGL